jgi:hypothetical protein
MEIDTLILLTLLAAALYWWLKLQITETRDLAKEKEKQRQDRVRRVERIKQLVNKQQPASEQDCTSDTSKNSI